MSRVGSETQTLKAGTIEELSKLDEEDFGGPLHSMVIVGSRLHPMERDFGMQFAVDKDRWHTHCTKHCGES